MYVVEGFTDIRFVLGLSETWDLTLVVPEATYGPSGLKLRVRDSGRTFPVVEIAGGKILFAIRAFFYCLRHARNFDVILAQEVTRGALAANLGGRLRGIPVWNYMGVSPLEYWSCRWQRRRIPYWKHVLGYATIHLLMTINGWLATGWLGMGTYLHDIGRQYTTNSRVGLYYGVDTDVFRPVVDRCELRRLRNLPLGAFIVFLSSRISHEKDPETVLVATHLARQQGLNAVVINLGGGYADFLSLAREMKLPDINEWVLGRPAAHPMIDLADYYCAADATAQASLAEGLGISPLESLSCGTPVVATSVGGLAKHLDEHARIIPKRDALAMAQQFIDIAKQPDRARAQALRARETYVIPEWNRNKAFEDLRNLLLSSRPTNRSVGH